MSIVIRLTEERDNEILTMENYVQYCREILEKFGFMAETEFQKIYGPQIGKVPKTPSARKEQNPNFG